MPTVKNTDSNSLPCHTLLNRLLAAILLAIASQTLNVVIPRNVRVSEAPSFGRTVISHDRSSIGAISYLEAAIEIAQRGAQNGR